MSKDKMLRLMDGILARIGLARKSEVENARQWQRYWERECRHEAYRREQDRAEYDRAINAVQSANTKLAADLVEAIQTGVVSKFTMTKVQDGQIELIPDGRVIGHGRAC